MNTKPRPAIDFNALVHDVHTSQMQDAGHMSVSPPKRIFTSNGRLIREEDIQSPDPSSLTEVMQDTFHAGWEKAERRIAETKMPANTRMVTTREGVRGWLYTFETEFRELYSMFAYFDGSFYQVKVISPEVECRFRSPHTGHLYTDGRICMGVGMNSGRRTLQDAYGKSVLWANGFNAMIRGNLEAFPFNYND